MANYPFCPNYFVIQSRLESQVSKCNLSFKDSVGVSYTISNNNFQFLNNITRIFTHFFTQTYFHTCFQTTKYMFLSACIKHPLDFYGEKLEFFFFFFFLREREKLELSFFFFFFKSFLVKLKFQRIELFTLGLHYQKFEYQMRLLNKIVCENKTNRRKKMPKFEQCYKHNNFHKISYQPS